MKMIYPEELKAGDVFIYKGRELTSIESGTPRPSEYKGLMLLWVTRKEFFIYPEDEGKYTYGYTNACVEPIEYGKKIPLICNIIEERRKTNGSM